MYSYVRSSDSWPLKSPAFLSAKNDKFGTSVSFFRSELVSKGLKCLHVHRCDSGITDIEREDMRGENNNLRTEKKQNSFSPLLAALFIVTSCFEKLFSFLRFFLLLLLSVGRYCCLLGLHAWCAWCLMNHGPLIGPS